jgi:serine/threonine protein kinase
VLEFGLAKPAAGRTGDSRAGDDGSLSGTPAYMAPEILVGKRADARSDLYAVGCVAYWLLTGSLVFESATPAAMAAAHISETPLPPSQHTRLPVPAPLEQIVLSCLAKEPAGRPQSALELAARLRECSVEPPWTAERAREWWSRRRPSAVPTERSAALTETRVLNPRERT